MKDKFHCRNWLFLLLWLAMNGNPLNRRPGAPGVVRQGEDAGGPPVEEERVGQPDERGVSFWGCCCARCCCCWRRWRGDVLPGVDHDVVGLTVGHKLDWRPDHSWVAVRLVEVIELWAKAFGYEIFPSISFTADINLVWLLQYVCIVFSHLPVVSAILTWVLTSVLVVEVAA